MEDERRGRRGLPLASPFCVMRTLSVSKFIIDASDVLLGRTNIRFPEVG